MKTLNIILTKWGMLFAFVLLAGIGIYAVNTQARASAETLYRTQLASCEQANVVRNESNQRIAAHILDRNVLARFLDSAAKAREASGSKTDLEAAAEYRRLRDSLRDVQFTSQSLIDCEHTIKKP